MYKMYISYRVSMKIRQKDYSLHGLFFRLFQSSGTFIHLCYKKDCVSYYSLFTTNHQPFLSYPY